MAAVVVEVDVVVVVVEVVVYNVVVVASEVVGASVVVVWYWFFFFFLFLFFLRPKSTSLIPTGLSSGAVTVVQVVVSCAEATLKAAKKLKEIFIVEELKKFLILC